MGVAGLALTQFKRLDIASDSTLCAIARKCTFDLKIPTEPFELHRIAPKRDAHCVSG